MRRIAWLTLMLLPVAVISRAHAQVPEDPAHAELRALRDDMVDAMNTRDIARLLRHVHANAVVTWQNAEVSRGPEGVRAYLTRMMQGPDRVVEDFNTSVAVDELTTLYGGDTGVAYGGSRDHFKLRGGQTFDLNSRWTATLVRDGGEWKIAAFHASTNLFDNPFVERAKRLPIIAAAVALVAGVGLGVLITRGRRRAGAMR